MFLLLKNLKGNVCVEPVALLFANGLTDTLSFMTVPLIKDINM